MQIKNKTKILLVIFYCCLFSSFSVKNTLAQAVYGECGTNNREYTQFEIGWPSISESAFCANGFLHWEDRPYPQPPPILTLNDIENGYITVSDWTCVGSCNGSGTISPICYVPGPGGTSTTERVGGANCNAIRKYVAPTPHPTLSFSAEPTRIFLGSPTTISWSATNASSCTASVTSGGGNWSGAKSTSDFNSQIVYPTSTGLKTYTLTCYNSGGSITRTALVEIINITPTNRAPIATIMAPSTNLTLTTGSTLNFLGTGSDPDGDSITGYKWTNNSCSGSNLSNQRVFSTPVSTPGTYIVYLSVQDSKGAWSTNCPSRTITVTSPTTYSCTGTLPSNATMCSGDNTGLTSSLAWQNVGTSSSSCTASRKCEYYIIPTCTASCGSWSSCSVSCGGGTQSRTCTNTNCSTYTQSQSCNTHSCCTPNWTPATNTFCNEVAFTQNDGCGNNRPATGTFVCYTPGYSTYSYSCSANALTTTQRFYTYPCVSGGCGSPTLASTITGSPVSCNTGTQNCAAGVSKSRCKDASTVERYKEYIEGTCNASLGRCDEVIRECDNTTEICEAGYTCKETGNIADCVPKSSTWTEI